MPSRLLPWRFTSADALRPLSDSEKLPPFSFDRMVGTWNIEWTVPESAFGTDGDITGTEVVSKVAEGFYASTIAAKGPDGPITGQAIQTLSPDTKYATRYESTSNGVATLMAGTASVANQQYVLSYESAPFTVKGKTVRLRRTLTFMSAGSIRMIAQMSEDGGPYRSYGSAWLRK